jgi:hypothetical protein
MKPHLLGYWRGKQQFTFKFCCFRPECTILFRSQLRYCQLKTDVLGTWSGSIISVEDKILVCNSSLYSCIFYLVQNYALSSIFFPIFQTIFSTWFIYILYRPQSLFQYTHNSTDYSKTVRECTNKDHCC